MNNILTHRLEKLLEEWKRDHENFMSSIKKDEEHLKIHLSKFKDIDKLFLDSKEIIEEYYKYEDFDNIEEFKDYLKWLIKRYIDSFYFEWDFEDLLKIRKQIEFIDEKYDKLIYFWEFNPVVERKKLLEQEKEEKISEKWEWIVFNIKKWVDNILKYFK